MNIIQAINLTKRYRINNIAIDALQDVNLKIEEGEFVAINGPSGSGKSTLLHMLGCIDHPTSGKIYINNTDTSTLSSKSLAKLRLRQLGFVFQQFHLLPTLTAFENVELPMREAGVPGKERRERTGSLLESVGLGSRTRHIPSQLSGGEQQRVAIARALANRPAIVFADEPTGELDSGTGRRILDIFKSINREFLQTIIIVSHDKSVTSRAHRVIHLKDGRIVQ
ncbi:MAG: ABC transporter ATP-binding protein [ANME-2 cluster archaeon]|nr:ABC transporter ATP-binding protein [ANME-2 cluster archaeon]MBC2701989.1 ABC transporter ATP-binding protein [ANME-2 cluster archaeon]MBC2708948.1 ABC transporter ATP-binding protein [ANME-2 cluster archaeon]MBC2745786.1 ABC transporter ATP-binding protein [ANME-2 cluster archaeon]